MSIKQNLKNKFFDLFILLKIFENNMTSLKELRNIVNFYKTNFDLFNYEDFEFFIYLESETDNFPEDSERELWNINSFNSRNNELLKIMKNNESYIKNNISNIISRYFIFRNAVCLNCSGQILYGKYLNNYIYIDKEQDNNLYNITMWNKDNNQEQQQFTFNSEKEVENFFRENDMVVKWEGVEE